jgi:hypothetical protein
MCLAAAEFSTSTTTGRAAEVNNRARAASVSANVDAGTQRNDAASGTGLSLSVSSVMTASVPREPTSSLHSGRDDAPQRGALRLRHIDGKLLSLGLQQFPQAIDANSRTDGNRHVAGGVVGHRGKLRGRNHAPVNRTRVAVVQRRAASDGKERQQFPARILGEKSTQLFVGGRREFVDF